MTERAPKINKTALIPKIGSIERYLLLAYLPEMEQYQAVLDKRTRLLTADEMAAIEEKYKEGLTWEEIELELSSRGIEMTKAAFRKHLHDKLLPGAEKRVRGAATKVTRQNEEGKALAVFPADTITQINFNRFFLKFADRAFLEEPLKALLAKPRVSFFLAIESCLDEKTHDGLRGALEDEIFYGVNSADEAIARALGSYPEERRKISADIDQLCRKMEEVRSGIDELVNYLAEKKLSIPEYLLLQQE